VSSDIDGGHDVGNASIEEYFAARDFHVDQAAVLLLEFPELLGCFAELSTRFCNISLNKRGMSSLGRMSRIVIERNSFGEYP